MELTRRVDAIGGWTLQSALRAHLSTLDPRGRRKENSYGSEHLESFIASRLRIMSFKLSIRSARPASAHTWRTSG
eukprot:2121379-Rhodomonas_salina.1